MGFIVMDTYWLLFWETNYLILLEQVQANYMKIIINGKTKTIEKYIIGIDDLYKILNKKLNIKF